MNKANLIRTAFNTIIEASILESRKEQEKGLTAAQKRAKRDEEAGGAKIRKDMKDISRQYPRSETKVPYGPRRDQISAKHAYTRGELHKGNPKMTKQSLAGHLAVTATSPEVRKRAGEKLLAKESTMNYRQSIRALFEAVMDHTIETIEESSAARKAAVGAKLAAAFAARGLKQRRLGQSEVKPHLEQNPYLDRDPATAKRARRVPRKVRGQLEPYGERGAITLDGKRQYVYDKAKLPIKSKTGRMARAMERDYEYDDEKQRDEQAAHDREWAEDDRELSNFFRGGRSRGMFK